MKSRRFTFVMEQTLGQISYTQNLQQALKLSEEDITVDWLPITFPAERWTEKLPIIRSNWSLRASLKTRRALEAAYKAHGHPDLYLFHTQVVSLLSSGWMSRSVPVVLSMDATPLNYDEVGLAYGHPPGNPVLEKFKFWLNRRAFHSANYLITVSDWVRRSLINDYGVSPSKIEVIPYGTNLEFWRNRGPVLKPAGKVRLLFVGGDFERKGGRLLYEVFRRELSERCELHLVTGSREIEPYPGVFVYNEVRPNTPQLLNLFEQADVFVLPTEGDCFPMSIVEAMAAGLPVVSTRVGAIEEEVVDGEMGFVVTPRDGEGLSAALNRLVENPELRLRFGAAGQRYADTHFDIAKNGQRLLDICKSLTEYPASRRQISAKGALGVGG